MKRKKNKLGLFGAVLGLAAVGCGIASVAADHKKETPDPDEIALHDWLDDKSDSEE